MMNSLRIARTASRAYLSATRMLVQRRGYADAVSDKIKLTLALPHQVGHPERIHYLLMTIFLSDVPLAIYFSVH